MKLKHEICFHEILIEAIQWNHPHLIVSFYVLLPEKNVVMVSFIKSMEIFGEILNKILQYQFTDLFQDLDSWIITKVINIWHVLATIKMYYFEMEPPLYMSPQLTINDMLMVLISHSYFTIFLAEHGETILMFKHVPISELCKYL